MPLFVCENCRCIENTATGYYWSAGRGLVPKEYDKKLCSECASPEYTDGTKTGYGKWHGKFDKVNIDDHIKMYPNSEIGVMFRNKPTD